MVRITLAALFAVTSLCSASAAEKPLKLLMIDVEGGAATLFVTPQGESVLVDTGWPPGVGVPQPPVGAPAGPPQPSSAERIVANAKTAGVRKIDYLIVTHYHTDHVGGFHDLLARIPVGTIVDHGPSREEPPPGLFAKYEPVSNAHERRVVKAGDVLQVGALKFTFVAADGQVLQKPLLGAGGRTAFCDTTPEKSAIGGEENARSIGFVAAYGKARILDLADLTWNRELALVCPINKLGAVDVLIVSHHGSELSSSPPMIDAVAPRVALMANGARKGGDKAVFDTLNAAASKPVIWQSHAATRQPGANRPADYIANLDVWPDAGHSIEADVSKDGTIKVVNARNGFTQTYPAK
jgi:beta-lactamase superfamily II metal-dependent hydrolase